MQSEAVCPISPAFPIHPPPPPPRPNTATNTVTAAAPDIVASPARRVRPGLFRASRRAPAESP